ncbi:uncharacterized protein I303_100401 [Kwoniella dejecticola CBS 10117]|uniref:Xylose isomerase-like TIM barrel domain-containing protein n=1 Tax=Kwoniella dejecticola CBS 10117 TaxID=1296121 RepID=A0AAJ8KI04_9TREE
MHQHEELDSSDSAEYRTSQIYQKAKDSTIYAQYRPERAGPTLDLDNPFLVTPPVNDRAIVSSSHSLPPSLETRKSTPELGFSQTSTLSSQILTPTECRPHDEARLLSPFSNLGSLTPGRKRKSSYQLESVPIPESPTPPARAEVTVTFESPLNNLGSCTPRRRDGQQPENARTPFDGVRLAINPPDTRSSLGLNSPLRRLGLCTPHSRPSTSSPQKHSETLPFISHQHRPTLDIPSPGWVPDTPTPYRFYPSPDDSTEADDLTIPRQPIFTPALTFGGQRKPSSTDIKPCLPLISPNIGHDNQQTASAGERAEAQAQVKINSVSHLSTDGGLAKSLIRLRARVDDYGTDVQGVNIFLHPPKRRVGGRSTKEIERAAEVMSTFSPEFRRNSMAHAVHTTNLLSSDAELRNRSKESIANEMIVARRLGIPTLVIHLGSEGRSFVGDEKVDLARMMLLKSDIVDILGKTQDLMLAIENTVHPSPSSLTTLQALALLLSHQPHPRLKICLDLAHLHISELDLNQAEHREDLFHMLKKIGKDRIAGVHVGGCATQHGGRNDRHAGGSLEISAIRCILRHPMFHGIPTLLETPRYNRGFRRSRASLCSTGRGRSRSMINKIRIEELEEDRSALERKLMQAAVEMSDLQWEEGELNGLRLMKKYKKEKKRIESRIYRLMSGGGGRGRGHWRRERGCLPLDIGVPATSTCAFYPL